MASRILAGATQRYLVGSPKVQPEIPGCLHPLLSDFSSCACAAMASYYLCDVVSERAGLSNNTIFSSTVFAPAAVCGHRCGCIYVHKRIQSQVFLSQTHRYGNHLLTVSMAPRYQRCTRSLSRTAQPEQLGKNRTCWCTSAGRGCLIAYAEEYSQPQSIERVTFINVSHNIS